MSDLDYLTLDNGGAYRIADAAKIADAVEETHYTGEQEWLPARVWLLDPSDGPVPVTWRTVSEGTSSNDERDGFATHGHGRVEVLRDGVVIDSAPYVIDLAA